MNLATYRDRANRIPPSSREFDMETLRSALEESSENPDLLRMISASTWYMQCLVDARSIDDVVSIARGRLCAAISPEPRLVTFGEIGLLGFVNFLACAGNEDCAPLLGNRLLRLKTTARGTDAERCWHFSRAFAGVALGMRRLYRDAAAADCELDELMPFTPRILYGYNPQALLAHLAAGAENRVAIEDVWPAFREYVHKFPSHEEVGDFDSDCLFWIARIVHHQIGGQPLGQTAGWLSRHFNAWADGRDLPPLGGAL